MQVRAFFPCEQIVSRMDGSFDIMRFGPQQIKLSTKNKESPIPVSMGIVCALSFSVPERGDKQLILSLQPPDGPAQELIRIDFKFEGKGGQEDFDMHGQAGLLVRKPGKHFLSATLGGLEIASWPIDVTNLII